MRVKVGEFAPLEAKAVDAIRELQQTLDISWVYGYQIVQYMNVRAENSGVYRALARLEKRGVLESQWYTPLADTGRLERPRRRYYRIVTE